MRLLIPLALLLLIVGCNRMTETVVPVKPAQEKPADTQYSKDIDEIRKSLKGDIRLKLKKDAKGGYSWEITGKDVQEVLKANDALRKKLSD
jgi:hypothetical protein